MVNFISILIALAVFTNCKKQKLHGDALLFKGSWQQVIPQPYPYQDEKPITLEFRGRGSYRIRKNGRLSEGGRIAYSAYTASNAWDFNITFHINSFVNPDKLMQKTMLDGDCVLKLKQPDTLILLQYPEQAMGKTYFFVKK